MRTLPSSAPSSLTALLAAVSAGHGSRVALVDDETSTTYAELSKRVERLAAGLAEAGIGRGDAVAIWLPNRSAWVELVFAVARLGAVAVGVNTRYRSRELLHVLKSSSAKALVVDLDFKGLDFARMLEESLTELPASLELLVTMSQTTPPSGLRARVHEYEALIAHDLPVVPDCSTSDSPSNAFSSSGTTGAPKLVLHSQGGIAAHSAAVAAAFGYQAPDARVLAALPMCGVFGFNTVLAAVAGAATSVMLRSFRAPDVVDLMRRQEVTHTNLSDEMLRRIIDESDGLASLPAWRECGFGAFTAVDPADLVNAGESYGKNFFQTFGSSEVQAVMAYPAPQASPERRSRGGGVPCHSDVEIRVRDEEGRLCDVGEPGEIEIKGPNVTCGYYGIDGIPDLDEDGFFHTGDLGVRGRGRDFQYLSRLGDVLRLAGFLVSPREIEAFLEDQPGVEGAQVVGVDLETDTAPVAFLTARAGARIDIEAIIAVARQELARFKVPHMVEVLDEFPVTKGTNGIKIQRAALRERATKAWNELTQEEGNGR